VASEAHAIVGTHGHGDAHAHGVLHHHFDDIEQQRECHALGMWCFLATEVMMFGGLFFAYSLYRWLFPTAFHVGSAHLNITLGTANTFVLLISSLTMALAVHAAGDRNRKALVGWLAATWILGAAFLGVKAIEWTHDWHIGLIPGLNWTYYDNPANQNQIAELTRAGLGTHHVLMYFTIYFMMTGLHALHMIVGLALVLVFIWMGARGAFTNGNDQPVEIMGLYWHLVDIVWIFLFPLLYLIAGFHPFGGGGH
jgi:cytochrome c oxidase subunit III